MGLSLVATILNLDIDHVEDDLRAIVSNGFEVEPSRSIRVEVISGILARRYLAGCISNKAVPNLEDFTTFVKRMAADDEARQILLAAGVTSTPSPPPS